MCCQDGDRLALSDDFGEGREHEWRPCRTATPQQASRKSAMPGDVVEPVERNGDIGGFVAIEFYVAVVKDVQHSDFGVFRQGGVLAAKIFKSLGSCLRSAAMTRANRGVRDDDQGTIRRFVACGGDHRASFQL